MACILKIGQMATITIASATRPNWQLSSDVQLRIYALQDFVAADGTLVPAGVPSVDCSQSDNDFQAVSCTLSGTTLTIASCTLLSTSDSQDNPAARHGAYFYTTEGQLIEAFGEFASFALPSAPSSTTWAAIAIAQAGGSL